jgi:hypothetical protein
VLCAIDAEKQHTINLFLGLFVPDENKPPIWDLITDYYLHHPQALGQKKIRRYLIYFIVPGDYKVPLQLQRYIETEGSLLYSEKSAL